MPHIKRSRASRPILVTRQQILDTAGLDIPMS